MKKVLDVIKKFTTSGENFHFLKEEILTIQIPL
jgi:hypothetical protein